MQRLATLKAGLSLSVIDLVELLEVAGLGVGVHELLVVERRATVLDRLGQDLGDCAVEAADLDGLERLGRPIKAQARREEDLVGVDVPNPGDDVLVREDGL